MKKIFLVLISLLFINCSDGDISVEVLDFDDATVKVCGEYVFFKLINDNKEALILQITSESINEEEGITTYTINNTTNKVLYRIFDGDAKDYFCKEVQPVNPKVVEEWNATNGTIEINTRLELDDNDGVPASQEGYNPDNPEASRDTDGDGLPDYIDADDDGDNVLTSSEGYDAKTPENSLDTDGDGIPDYLDKDDDGDGIDTKFEDADNDGPRNDKTNGYENPNYLEADITTSYETTFVIEQNYFETYVSTIRIINGFQLQGNGQEIKYDVETFDYGTYQGTSTSVTHNFQPEEEL